MENAPRENLLTRITERLVSNRESLQRINQLMAEELKKKFSQRSHRLTIFLAGERKMYSAVVAELERLSRLQEGDQ